MEDNAVINSCLMWAVGLYTPVDLRYIFDEEDLKDTGVELDSHITLLYAAGKRLPRKSIMDDIKTILGDDYGEFIKYCEEIKYLKVLDLFEISSFENDSDYLILKLKNDNPMFKWCSLINKSLRTKYGVKSDYDKYTPHMTLAELKPGTVSKYLESETLDLLLNDTMIDFEDVLISYGSSNEVKDRRQYYLTQYKNVDRYFRLQRLEKEVID